MAGLLKGIAGLVALVLVATAGVPEMAGALSRPAVRDADLQITKTVSPDPMVIGAEAVYTVTVTNAGDRAATGVKVTDTLPGQVTAGTKTGPATVNPDGTITCKLEVVKRRQGHRGRRPGQGSHRRARDAARPPEGVQAGRRKPGLRARPLRGG